MKNIFFIILLALTTNLFCQKSTEKPLTAGDELLKANKQYYTGMAVSSVGLLITGMGIYISKPSELSPAIYMGAIFAGVGSIISIHSHVHIGRAGRLLNEKNLSFTVSPVGAGICLKF